MRLLIILSYLLIIPICLNAETKEAKLKRMFNTAMKNSSTSPNFIVINVVDLKTNESKYLCTESTTLSYALHLDSQELNFNKISYSSHGIPIVKLKSDNAIEQIAFHGYNPAIVDSIIHNTELSIISEILKQSEREGYSKLLEINTLKFDKNYFEHYLYLSGILTYRDCETGNTIVDKND